MSSSRESSDSKLDSGKEDLQVDISLEAWKSICIDAQTRSINSQLKLLQYNWIMRTYITPVKFNKING